MCQDATKMNPNIALKFNTFALLALVASALVAGLETDFHRGFKSACGTGNQVAKRVSQCMDQVFELVEGKVPKPKNDQDLQATCDRFSFAERCIRSNSKDCLSGIHRTTVGSVSAATKRFRLKECSSPATRAKYANAVECTNKKSKELNAIFHNHTALLQAIRDDPKLESEVKLMKSCCIWPEIDRDLTETLINECPKELPIILAIIHAMADDARNTVCLRPKCANAFAPYINKPYKGNERIIEPVFSILFMLTSE